MIQMVVADDLDYLLQSDHFNESNGSMCLMIQILLTWWTLVPMVINKN